MYKTEGKKKDVINCFVLLLANFQNQQSERCLPSKLSQRRNMKQPLVPTPRRVCVCVWGGVDLDNLWPKILTTFAFSSLTWGPIYRRQRYKLSLKTTTKSTTEKAENERGRSGAGLALGGRGQLCSDHQPAAVTWHLSSLLDLVCMMSTHPPNPRLHLHSRISTGQTTERPAGQRTEGPVRQRIQGPAGQRTEGQVGQRTVGPAGQRTEGPAELPLLEPRKDR